MSDDPTFATGIDRYNQAVDARAERDALMRVLADVYTAMYPPPTGPGVDHTELPVHVAAMRAERDRLRAVVDTNLSWLREMTDMARDLGDHTVADVTARQYRAIVAQLDGSGDMGWPIDDTTPMRDLVTEDEVERHRPARRTDG